MEERRVLGCLIEKCATTPETYPLTMNALVAACNQSSNRDPVLTLDEAAVSSALTTLREHKLIRIVYPAHARVTKYRHVLDEAWALTAPELAVLAVLLLRGGQTHNELVARTERYGDPADFADLGGVAGILDRLAGRPEPLVRLVGRRPGQREDRYHHLLGPATLPEAAPDQEERAESDQRPSNIDRILALEVETATLRVELANLREWLEKLLGEPIPPPEPRPGYG